ncbi:hypothetical protein [Rickettsia endosymbiont of Urophora cardui]|uniref:hypothetical protein n=1 Tax=Rickettsia endosymbiont of Urophora cardui TaxID=3066265 RepID=UPI00313B740C
MSDISNIKHDIKINNIQQYPELREELTQIAGSCLEELQAIRKELTMAYIVSGTIVVEENGHYEVKDERGIRQDGKQTQDLDRKQRKEEQNLKDLILLCNIKHDISDHTAINDKTENKDNKKGIKNNFLRKMFKLLEKIVKALPFYKDKNKSHTVEQSDEQLDPVESIQQGIKILKEYKQVLKLRTDKLSELETLQSHIQNYKSRIVQDPQKYNKDNYISKLQEKTMMHNKNSIGRGI